MATNTRGFLALSGETIVSCNTTAINIVTVYCKSGKVVEINADDQHFGIAVVQCEVIGHSVKGSGVTIFKDKFKKD